MDYCCTIVRCVGVCWMRCLTRIRRLAGIAFVFAPACASEVASASGVRLPLRANEDGKHHEPPNQQPQFGTTALSLAHLLLLRVRYPSRVRTLASNGEPIFTTPSHPCPYPILPDSPATQVPREAALHPDLSSPISNTAIRFACPMTPGAMHNPIDTSTTHVCSCSPPSDLDASTQAPILQRPTTRVLLHTALSLHDSAPPLRDFCPSRSPRLGPHVLLLTS